MNIDGQLGGWSVVDGYLIVPKTGNYLLELNGYAKVVYGNTGSNIIWIDTIIINSSSKSYSSCRAIIREHHATNRDIVFIDEEGSKQIIYLTAGEKIKVKIGEQCSNATASCLVDIYAGFKLMEV